MTRNRLAYLAFFVPLFVVSPANDARSQAPDVRQLQEISPDRMASDLLQFDLVAIGIFETPAESANDMATYFRNTELIIPFTVREIFKGSVAPGAVVQITLQSDMLAYPGDAISRYEQRNKELKRRLEILQKAAAEIDNAEQAMKRGQITREEFGRQVREVDMRNARFNAETMEIAQTQRSVNVSHGTTFYQRGGVIHPGKPYLIAAIRSNDSPVYYAIDDTLGFSVLWGDLAQSVRSVFERQSSDTNRRGR